MSMYPAIEDSQRAVARLFPRFARCAVQVISERCTTPFVEELRAVTMAAPARRQEFVCGRACAHAALRALGATDAPIPMARSRQPIWPDGIVGSISHTRSLAGAVVCHAGDARAVGLDVETAVAPAGDGWRRLVLTPAESLQVDALRGLDVRVAVLIFSAKECVHKVVAPLWGYTLDHQEVEVRIELDARRFTATFASHTGADGVSAAGNGATQTLHGSFTYFDDHVATGICIERPPAVCG